MVGRGLVKYKQVTNPQKLRLFHYIILVLRYSTAVLDKFPLMGCDVACEIIDLVANPVNQISKQLSLWQTDTTGSKIGANSTKILDHNSNIIELDLLLPNL